MQFGCFPGQMSDLFFFNAMLEAVDINLLGALLVPQPSPTPMLGAPIRPSCAPAWWHILPLVGQWALMNAADCSGAATARTSIQEVVRRIYSHVGLAPGAIIPDGTKVSREDIGIDDSVVVHIDVGGEGPVRSGRLATGFQEAINLQAPAGSMDGAHQTQPPYGLIPNLVRMSKSTSSSE